MAFRYYIILDESRDEHDHYTTDSRYMYDQTRHAFTNLDREPESDMATAIDTNRLGGIALAHSNDLSKLVRFFTEASLYADPSAASRPTRSLRIVCVDEVHQEVIGATPRSDFVYSSKTHPFIYLLPIKPLEKSGETSLYHMHHGAVSEGSRFTRVVESLPEEVRADFDVSYARYKEEHAKFLDGKSYLPSYELASSGLVDLSHGPAIRPVSNVYPSVVELTRVLCDLAENYSTLEGINPFDDKAREAYILRLIDVSPELFGGALTATEAKTVLSLTHEYDRRDNVSTSENNLRKYGFTVGHLITALQLMQDSKDRAKMGIPEKGDLIIQADSSYRLIETDEQLADYMGTLLLSGTDRHTVSDTSCSTNRTALLFGDGIGDTASEARAEHDGPAASAAAAP